MSGSLVAGNVVSLYATPDSSSEQVTQALLGDLVQVTQAEGDWRSVETADHYRGWLPAGRLVPAWDTSDYFQTTIATLFASVFREPDPQAEMVTKLTVSATAVVAHRAEVEPWVPLLLPDRSLGYIHQSCLNSTHETMRNDPALLDLALRRTLDVGAIKRQFLEGVGPHAGQVARRFIGTPYLWGGCTPFGIDCSGLVQLVYKLSGITLLRDADLQMRDRRFVPAEPGRRLDEADLAPGDLVFFGDGRSERATHTGIALGDGRFLHAAGGRGVVIDGCETARYVQTFLSAQRLSADADLSIQAT